MSHFQPFIEDWTKLIDSVRDDISPEFRAYHDEEPGIQLTVATNDKGDEWSYQTGDNSFTGGAYGLPHWAVIGVYADTVTADAIDDITNQLIELTELYS